jgi:hypothetical protein
MSLAPMPDQEGHMGRCRILRAVQCAIVVVSLVGGRAAWAGVAIGASFGYTHFSYPNSPHYKDDVLGLPGTQARGQPGLRIGYLARGGRWDLNADVGLVTVHHSGTISANETTVEALPQVQVNAPSWHGLNPFVNGGVGVVHETALTTYGSSFTATRPVFGAGIGVRKPVSDGHGLIRAELRYDHLPEHVTGLTPYDSFDSFTFPATDLFSVKLGFDLVVAH